MSMEGLFTGAMLTLIVLVTFFEMFRTPNSGGKSTVSK